MQRDDRPILRDIVLVGGGHSHVGVVRMFGMRPESGVRLTLVCTDTHTPYSGMLPGYIAGHYAFDDVHIDLRKLCMWAGARYILAEATGIDRAQRQVRLRGRPALAYDRISINIGSTPALAPVSGAAEHAVAVKPIARFNDRWLRILDRVRGHPGRTTVAVVGGGAGGVEILLAMQHRLRSELRTLRRDPGDVDFHLLTAEPDILSTHNSRVRAHFRRVLRARGVSVHLGAQVLEVRAGSVRASRVLDSPKGGSSPDWLHADEVVFVTNACGADWLRGTGLSLDESGFVKVDDCLRSLDDPDVFAAGDGASMVNHPREKAGVFAVRQGAPLARNLRRSLRGQPLLPYRPQKHWLALISTGDRHAVASRGPIGVAGDWVWRWKDWIDRRFMRRFSEFPPMDRSNAAPAASVGAGLPLEAEEAKQAISAIAMRCGGCGAKVGSDVLSRALGGLSPVARDDVLIGLHAPDDAAIVRVPPGMAVVQTVDFFRALVDDPYVFGRVAANHALGDIFAMGGEAQTATAIVTVPPGLESKLEDLLRQLLGGAVDVLNEAGCALVGGHTGEGRELALGFAINGLVDESLGTAMRKGGMKAGDVLILTKPIGTGTLFAAYPRGAARGRWIDAALASMQQSSRAAARCLRAHGATACTDLTGFGLLGHLVEMTRPSGVDAEIDLAALPVLPGAEACVAAGILSSLQPANIRLRRAIRDQAKFTVHPRYPLLFDPQTAGGMLASVPAARATACLARLRELGYLEAAQVGRVLPQAAALEPIVLKA